MSIVLDHAVGPVLEHNQNPWPDGWELSARTDDGHAHEWESVLLKPGKSRYRLDEVQRCSVCHAPRCDRTNLTEDDRCLNRRHHQDPHIFPRGGVMKVGG